MKFKALLIILIIGTTLLSCKKDNTEPSHTIKIKITGQESFFVTGNGIIDNTNVEKYYFQTVQKSAGFDIDVKGFKGSIVTAEISSDINNIISYEVYDNAKLVLNENDKELKSGTPIKISYTVQ